MKKILSFLVLCLTVFAISIGVYASSDVPTLEIESKDVLVTDDTVTIDFTLSNTEAITGLGIANIEFDEARFSLESGIWTLPDGTSIIRDYELFNDVYVASAAYPSNTDCNGEIFRLTLKVLDTATVGTSEVSCEFSATNKAGTKVEVTNVPATVAVHKYDKKIANAETLKSAATCTEDAVYYYSCECGKVDTSNTWVKADTAIGHKGGSATCKEKAKCSTCGVQYGALAEHKPVSEGNYAATCTKTGWTGKTVCSVCDKVIAAGKSVTKKAHTYKTTVKKATFTADGKRSKVCSVCKATASSSVIRKVSNVKIAATKYNYSGKTITPKVTVKDSKGNTLSSSSDYKVTYQSGRKNVGKYKVTVTLRGDYSGTKNFYFEIVPPKTTLKKVTSAKRSLKVTFTKKTTQVSGYEVQYATSKSFKGAKIKRLSNNRYTSTTITGLSSRKTYYVRIRTYKTVSGKKYYSAWSNVRSGRTR